MGVPAFFRWLTEKYPKVLQDVLEERVGCCNGVAIPVDWSQGPNPSGLECDALYVDMNGIIHPCAHPEHGDVPTSEPAMYEAVCRYVDRLCAAIRPRQVLFLAIDGVAPRAKMNQQRARRFRSAQERKELQQTELQIQQELNMIETLHDPANSNDNTNKQQPEQEEVWDSNVITPGTPFMLRLSEYIRFYVRKRISTHPGWKTLKVLFSDASVPGEGEHKIMAHVRQQRCQAGYDPNTVHVLHGLDADLIMLGLATHEAHFYISREEVLFGRKSIEMQEQRQMQSGFHDRQRALNEAVGPEAMALPDNQQKPLQLVSIPILREYWRFEFANPCLNRNKLTWQPNMERLIDDLVFLCFFVGNDFLPHLPSLDIRDGALDYLFNVYKRILPSLGDYITSSGGTINLQHVDVLLAEVGSIEDQVFTMKYENEMAEKERRQQQKEQRKQQNRGPPLLTNHNNNNNNNGPRRTMGRSARILERANNNNNNNHDGGPDVVALSRGHAAKEESRQQLKAARLLKADPSNTHNNNNNSDKTTSKSIMAATTTTLENQKAAQALRNQLQQKASMSTMNTMTAASAAAETSTATLSGSTASIATTTTTITTDSTAVTTTVADIKTSGPDGTIDAAATSSNTFTATTTNTTSSNNKMDTSTDNGAPASSLSTTDAPTREKAAEPTVEHESIQNGKRPREQDVEENQVDAAEGVVGEVDVEFEDDANEEDDNDANDDDEEEEDISKDIEAVNPKIKQDPEKLALFKQKVKEAQQKKLEEYAATVEDKVRLHEKGWKDRYYRDKCKADDVEKHGGREHLFRSYVVGLCWVMKYYYEGCPSWKWYYPFHYAPFASDLKNIERFARDCRSFELSKPFSPVEQLMAVLPPDSAHAIPKASQWLMLDREGSPIVDFYPLDVPVDPNGKAMPWLWVVLLPFIDEERLLDAMAPTMAKWTKEELLCNARGLDDGYLFVHKDHEMALKIRTVLGTNNEKTAGSSSKIRLSNAATYGIAGSLRPPLHDEVEANPTGTQSSLVPVPPTAHEIERKPNTEPIFADPIDPNHSLCVAFTEPPRLSHKSILLPGSKPPPPVLTESDLRIRRPRLNRGGASIANLGGNNGVSANNNNNYNNHSDQSGYGSMNISSYERQLAQETGRGHQMHQAGTRTWGSLEPTPKRPRHLQHQQPQQFGGRYHQQQHPPPPPPPPPRVGNPFLPGNQHQQGQSNQPPPYSAGQPAAWQNGPRYENPRFGNNHQPGYQQGGPHNNNNNNTGSYSFNQKPPQQQQYYNDSNQHQRHGNQQYSQGPRGPPPPSHPNSYSFQNHQNSSNNSRPPHQPQQGFDFRSTNNNPPHPQSFQRPQPPQQQQRSRASADVMNNLRAQLTNTLRQNQSRSQQQHPSQHQHQQRRY